MIDNRTRDVAQIAETIANRFEASLLAAVKCCVTCQTFAELDEKCHNVVNCPQGPARPPARIIAYGCNQYLPLPPF